MQLPDDIRAACAPLFEALPLEETMTDLTGSAPKRTSLVEAVLANPALEGRLDLEAALWLYVDDLERSHRASQANETVTGSLWHGIMHRREGDFSNSLYWMRRASQHPLFGEIDPAGFVDLVSQDGGRNAPELVRRQRAEWKRLFEWCCAAG